jgi:hypothetical protein
MLSIIRAAGLTILGVVLSCSALLAQLTTATISGTLTDPSGAVVPDAQVTAVEMSTGVVTRAAANSAGFYVLTGLAPGQYRVRVEKAGFQASVQEGIVVEVNRPVTSNIALQLGAATQTVTVSAVGEQVNLRSQTISHEVNTQMVTQLPLNGRNILQLMQLAPDVGPTTSAPYQQLASRPENANAYVGASGGRGDSTAYYLDGGLNEDALTLIANIFPNPDAIQEFSFQTNNYSAKFGGQGGGVMNAVTRGGTNQFHGALYEFIRNSDLNGHNFFAASQDGLKRNQYGGTIGGPLQKNKTFFFFSYQGTELRQTPSSNSATTPTAAARAGNYVGNSKIVDPSTGAPFPNGLVPGYRQDPIAMKILSWVPVGAPGTGLVYYTSSISQSDNQYVARVDHNIGDKLRLYGSYLWDGLHAPSTTIPNNVLTATADQAWTSQNLVLNATYTFRPNLLATFVGSLSRRSNLYTGPTGFPDWPDLGVNIPKLVTQGSKTSMNLGITNYFSLAWNGFYIIPATAGNVGTHWTYIKGNHTFEFGAEILKTKVVKNQDFLSDGSYTFGGGLSGDNALDFMLGLPSSFTQRTGYYFAAVRNLPAMYVTDTWKASRRLTLSLGLRWNPFVPVYDSTYRQEAVFDYQLYSQGYRSTLYPNVAPGLSAWGDPATPNRGDIIKADYHLFDPRVGLAWDPFGDGKTGVRIGYGVYGDQMPSNTINPGYSPFVVNATFAYPVSIENPYQGHLDPFPVARPVPSTAVFPIPMTAQPFTFGMRPTLIQQWNTTVERQFGWASLVRVAYEGQSADHLPGGIEGNAPIYNPALTVAANRTSENARRPMATWYQGLILAENVGTSSFESLNVSLEKRMTQGLTFLTGYRWSKCLDEAEVVTYTSYAYISTNPRLDHGPCGYNVPNQFRFSYVWRIPTPRIMGGFGKAVFGGWETNGLLTLRDGLPFSVNSGVDNSASGIAQDRADIVGDPALPSGRSRNDEWRQWFNTAAFKSNAASTFGTSSRNMLIGPGLSNLDFSIIRAFPLRFLKGESRALDFRGEFFNLFNHTNFNNPNATVSSGSYGRISGAADPRIVQFGLKFVY